MAGFGGIGTNNEAFFLFLILILLIVSMFGIGCY